MVRARAGGPLLALLLTGCGGGSGTETVRSERACEGRDSPKAGAPSVLPLGLPLTEGATVLEVTSQGRTTVAFAKVPGTRDTIVAVRDRVLADLKTAGYETVETDQEPGFEAEAQIRGRYEGTLKVAPLCEGLLEVRYKIEQ